MQTIVEYRSLAPMAADELILQANRLLSQKGASLISKRTLRFYTSQGVVPGPLGSPKFARYGYEHLLSLLSARALQDQGHRLDGIRRETQEVTRGRYDRMETMVNDWLAAPKRDSSELLAVKESDGPNPEVRALVQIGTPTIRIPLTSKVTIEITNPVSVQEELERCARELEKLISKVAERG